MGSLPFRFRNLEWIGEPVSRPAPDAPELDLGDLIAFRGLVNAHDHLEFNCYPPTGNPPYREFLDWGHDVLSRTDLVRPIEAIPMALRQQAGALKNLLWGVTAVCDHTAEPGPADPIRIVADFDFIHSPEAGRKRRRTLLSGGRKRPVVLHLAEGVTAESRDRAVSLLRWNIFGRPVVGVHGVSLRPEDFARLTALVWCPASNNFLFGRTADLAAAKTRTEVLFGTDSTLSAPGTIWDHLRLARGTGLDDAELIAAVTRPAARLWGAITDQDFVVCRRKHGDVIEAFFAVVPGDILLVMCQGEVVLADECIAPGFPDLEPACAGKFVKLPMTSLAAELGRHLDVKTLFTRYVAG